MMSFHRDGNLRRRRRLKYPRGAIVTLSACRVHVSSEAIGAAVHLAKWGGRALPQPLFTADLSRRACVEVSGARQEFSHVGAAPPRERFLGDFGRFEELGRNESHLLPPPRRRRSFLSAVIVPTLVAVEAACVADGLSAWTTSEEKLQHLMSKHAQLVS